MPETLLTPDTLSKQTYLAPQKREHIQQNIRALEWALRGRSMHMGMDMPHDIPIPGFAPPEPEILRESLEKEQALLEASTPPELSAFEKNKLYRRVKELDELITHDMPTYDMMEVPTMNNVEHHMAWERLHKQHILERRAILRILDPDNESTFFTSVEQLRTTTAPKGNPRQFFQKFDYLQFQEVAEEQLQVIDDESYIRFLQLKNLHWADMTICKELGWSKEVFNAAMTRWRQAIMEGSYTKFLELQAAGCPAATIRELLGWSQDLYDEAMQRWQTSTGGQVPVSRETPAPAPAAQPMGAEDVATLATPWFAPAAKHNDALEASRKIAATLSQRMALLDLRPSDLAKHLQVHHLTLGRKLTGKATLTPEDVQRITAYLDACEVERGYTSPDEIPLGGDPAAA